jgi:hypothetical protein
VQRPLPGQPGSERSVVGWRWVLSEELPELGEKGNVVLSNGRCHLRPPASAAAAEAKLP